MSGNITAQVMAFKMLQQCQLVLWLLTLVKYRKNSGWDPGCDSSISESHSVDTGSPSLSKKRDGRGFASFMWSLSVRVSLRSDASMCGRKNRSTLTLLSLTDIMAAQGRTFPSLVPLSGKQSRYRTFTPLAQSTQIGFLFSFDPLWPLFQS